jgi:hypothetical protein
MNAEDIAYWFFRLNGCLNIQNFLVHHEQRGREGTDIDILAVRFPYRQELKHAKQGKPMLDHECFQPNNRIDLIIAEVKRGDCNLNGPWTDPQKRNMDRVLYAIGAFQDELISQVADALYNEQYYENDMFRVRLFAIGQQKNQELLENSKNVVQLSLDEVLRFIYYRFHKYHHQKAQHRQWGDIGSTLFVEALNNEHPDEYIDKILREMM